MTAISSCIAWASQAGFVGAEAAAIEYARQTGTQAVWKDLGLYPSIIEFRQTSWRNDTDGQGWEVRTRQKGREIFWNRADETRVLKENCFGVVEPV